MLVRDLATEHPKTVTPEFSIRNVLDLLRNNEFRHVPVVDRNRNVRGIFSESDLTSSASMARIFGRDRDDYEAFLQTPVADVMKTRFSDPEGLVTVGPDDSVETAARTLLENKVGALPVVEPDGTLFGIISYVDILREVLRGDLELEEEEG